MTWIFVLIEHSNMDRPQKDTFGNSIVFGFVSWWPSKHWVLLLEDSSLSTYHCWNLVCLRNMRHYRYSRQWNLMSRFNNVLKKLTESVSSGSDTGGKKNQCVHPESRSTCIVEEQTSRGDRRTREAAWRSHRQAERLTSGVVSTFWAHLAGLTSPVYP